MEWYWGHASVGNYSLVWFYYINLQKKATPSIYLSLNGQILVSACATSGKVTPLGSNITTPVQSTETITGWSITFEDALHRSYAFEVENVLQSQGGQGPYTRWIGRAVGGLVGGSNSTGPAICEHMSNPAVLGS